MRLVIAFDHRFVRTPDGSIWTRNVYPYQFWLRYLEVFDRVQIVARVEEIEAPSDDLRRVDGDSVTVAAVAYYLGPLHYLTKIRKVNRAVRAGAGRDDAVICRIPSTIGMTLCESLVKLGHPFGLQVVGDPDRVFTPGVVDHPLRPILRRWYSHRQRRLCSLAVAVGYVAKGLQTVYPAHESAFKTVFSDVELPESAYASKPKAARNQPPSRIVFVGSLAQHYKGVTVLLNAFARCIQGGLDLSLIIVGDGKLRSEYEDLATRLGVRSRVEFTGELPSGDAVRDRLDEADLFVLPSLTEGLPRALLEAMARGLPCLGSAIGGIPQLLEEDSLVTPGDAADLESRIREVLSNPELMNRMAARNLATARDYSQAEMSARQLDFYREVRRAAEAASSGAVNSN